MTTQVNDIADIVRILRERPDWLETIKGIIVGEELMSLPREVAKFVEATNENFRLIHERLDRLEAGQAELKGDVTELKAGQAELKGDVAELKSDVVELKSDVVELKSDVAELKSDVVELKSDVVELKSDVVELKSDVTELKSDVVELKSDVVELKSDVTELKSDVTELKSDVVELKSDVTELKAGQAELKGDVVELKDSQAETNRRLGGLERRFNRMEGRFSNFEGSDYERKVRQPVLMDTVLELGLSNPAIVLTQDGQSTPSWHGSIHRAIRAGRISLEQARDLGETDLIIADEDGTHVLVEASITASNSDIERAVRRAGVLASIIDATVLPAVATSILAEPQRAFAERQGVSVFIVRYREANVEPDEDAA